MCVSESHARTTWSVSRCYASTALPPSFPRPPFCFVPSIPSRAFAAAARLASLAIIVKRRSTCVTPTPVWMVACVLAEREGSPVSAVKTTLVSKESVCWREEMWPGIFMWPLFVEYILPFTWRQHQSVKAFKDYELQMKEWWLWFI